MAPSSKDKLLYYIALLPNVDVQRQAKEHMQVFATKYESKSAFRSPPHITLHMPFQLSSRKADKLTNLLTEFSANISPFEIYLNGFGAFEPRVIFINVDENTLLRNVQAALSKYLRVNMQLFNANYKHQAYHPHITIAFRDLKKPAFEQAWAVYKNESFMASFIADGITLLKHNGKSWDVNQHFKFLADETPEA